MFNKTIALLRTVSSKAQAALGWLSNFLLPISRFTLPRLQALQAFAVKVALPLSIGMTFAFACVTMCNFADDLSGYLLCLLFGAVVTPLLFPLALMGLAAAYFPLWLFTQVVDWHVEPSTGQPNWRWRNAELTESVPAGDTLEAA